MGVRRQFSQEFKLQAVRLVTGRGLSVAQASRELDVGEAVLRRWVRELKPDPRQARQMIPGPEITRPDQPHTEAEEHDKLAATIFSHAREGIMITSPDGNIIDVNPAFTRITGYTKEEVLGKNPRVIKSSMHHDPEFYAAMWRDILGKGSWSGEIWNRRKNGELYPELQTLSSVKDEQGKTRYYVALATDISPMREHDERIKHMADFDPLTTLPNHALLEDRLQLTLHQTLQRKQLLAVICVDLDGFKAINDTHGYSVGDQLLVALASRLRQVLRDSDTLARLGGDQFVVVLIDLNSVSASLSMLNRLLSAVARPVRIGELELQVSASLGVAFHSQSEQVDTDLLLRQADQAMYQAKQAGGNRYQIFDTDEDKSARSRNESIERIRHALAGDEFVLYYQPKVNMHTGKIVGVEALIYWQHPDKGLLSPDDFLPVIENHQLAVDLGEWTIARVLEQIDLWRDAGLKMPISINVCARLMQQGDFPARLKQFLARHPMVDPGKLTLELPENEAIEDLASVSGIIEECREFGVLFALDDFGTGSSSLAYLKHLSADQFKIDQSFVRDMLDNPDDLTILAGVISLAEAFCREVVAEGVETSVHGEILLLLGCELAQGHGIARPMAADALLRWAANWRPYPGWKALRPLAKNDLPLLFAGIRHRAWVLDIGKSLDDEAALSMQHGPDSCSFSEWLASEGEARYGKYPRFSELQRLHDELSDLAKSLCEQKRKGKTRSIRAGKEKLHALSDALFIEIKTLLTERERRGGR
jgi:diguanylate cyclase (GGDEF)-like protein/PAS domain S-box-containing protein